MTTAEVKAAPAGSRSIDVNGRATPGPIPAPGVKKGDRLTLTSASNGRELLDAHAVRHWIVTVASADGQLVQLARRDLSGWSLIVEVQQAV